MPRILVSRLLVAGLALGLSACGGDKSPTQPSTPVTPAAPTVLSVTVTGLDAIRTGFYYDYVATAQMSDNTSKTVTAEATWASSTANASAEATGRLSGRAHGPTVMSATYQGKVGTKNVAIVNNYGGVWGGTYVARACDASGAFRSNDWCRGITGGTYPFALTLSQSGNDRSQVTGTLRYDFATVTVNGAVTSDGRLNIAADSVVSFQGLSFRFQLGGWDTRKNGETGMIGRTAVNLTTQSVSGNYYEEDDINNALLVSSTAALVAER